jgi:hypothetical protein
MNNKLRQGLRAMGLVIGVYGILTLLAVGILSIPKEYGPDIIMGFIFGVCTYFAYRMALDYVKWREENSGL